MESIPIVYTVQILNTHTHLYSHTPTHTPTHTHVPTHANPHYNISLAGYIRTMSGLTQFHQCLACLERKSVMRRSVHPLFYSTLTIGPDPGPLYLPGIRHYTVVLARAALIIRYSYEVVDMAKIVIIFLQNAYSVIVYVN